MVGVDTSSASRKAAVTRIVVTALSIVPIGFVGLAYAASGPLGIPLAIPTLYMLWALGADTVALLKGGNYRARPTYKWIVLAGVLVIAMWIALLVSHGAKFG